MYEIRIKENLITHFCEFKDSIKEETSNKAFDIIGVKGISESSTLRCITSTVRKNCFLFATQLHHTNFFDIVDVPLNQHFAEETISFEATVYLLSITVNLCKDCFYIALTHDY